MTRFRFGVIRTFHYAYHYTKQSIPRKRAAKVISTSFCFGVIRTWGDAIQNPLTFRAAEKTKCTPAVDFLKSYTTQTRKAYRRLKINRYKHAPPRTSLSHAISENTRQAREVEKRLNAKRNRIACETIEPALLLALPGSICHPGRPGAPKKTYICTLLDTPVLMPWYFHVPIMTLPRAFTAFHCTTLIQPPYIAMALATMPLLP